MNYTRTVLPNGLRVITIPMPSFESVTALVMVGAGSRYEAVHNSGISHFLEHMAFKGTEKRSNAMVISSLIDGMGGEFNAFTGKETTGYYIKAAKTKLELMLDILSDMLINSKLEQTEIDKEKGVIIEEINLYEDMPMRKIGDVYEGLLYGDRPMGWDIAGNKEVILGTKRKDFTDYLSSLYSPHNMTVVIAGGTERGEAEGLVEKYFGNMKRFETVKALKMDAVQDKPGVMLKEKKTEQTHIALGFKTVDMNSPEHYPLTVLSSILGGGMSSRLFHEVREKRGLAYYVRASSDEYTDCGSLFATAGVDPKRALEAVEVMMEEFRKVSTGKAEITQDELKKAKEYLKGHLVLELEDSRSVAGFFAHQELLEKEIRTPEEILTKVDAVSLEDIKRVGESYFKNAGLNLAVIGQVSDRQKLEKLVEL